MLPVCYILKGNWIFCCYCKQLIVTHQSGSVCEIYSNLPEIVKGLLVFFLVLLNSLGDMGTFHFISKVKSYKTEENFR